MNPLKIFQEDAQKIAQSTSIDWALLAGKNVLITGATGLIGTTIIRGLLEYNETNDTEIGILALVRNEEKANSLFGDAVKNGQIKLLVGDVLEKIKTLEPVDFIIHGASETASRAFVETPVETILTAIDGTRNLLEFARDKQVHGMVYLSSMEVYGRPADGEVLTEDKMGYLDPMAVRSSYSESKRMVENLCVSYAAEYHVPVKIVRLTQCFGPGVGSRDARVFAEFARNAVQGRDICLQTKGETKRMYLYTADAATAILAVLTRGREQEAYNAANASTYCSIAEMAQLVAEAFGEGKCRVVFAGATAQNQFYNPTMEVFMDMTKLEKLGWQAMVGLREMYERMIACM